MIRHWASKILVIIHSKFMRTKLFTKYWLHFNKRIIFKHRCKTKRSEIVIEYHLLILPSIITFKELWLIKRLFKIVVKWWVLSEKIIHEITLTSKWIINYSNSLSLSLLIWNFISNIFTTISLYILTLSLTILYIWLPQIFYLSYWNLWRPIKLIFINLHLFIYLPLIL
jgi:hypothetical protein